MAGRVPPAERIALSAARDREAILYQFSSHEVQLITADLIGTEPITATGNISYEDAGYHSAPVPGLQHRPRPLSGQQPPAGPWAWASTGRRW